MVQKQKLPLIFIVGPTASGKSDVAFELAGMIDAHIVSCDSMMVYKEPCVLTNKPDKSMRAVVEHHMLDLVSVEEEFNAVAFAQEVYRIVDEIYPEKNIILCGGTGLYARIMINGIFDDGVQNKEIRQHLEQQYNEHGLEPLRCRLKEMDAETYNMIENANPRRVIRALEVLEATGESLIGKQSGAQGLADKYPVRMFILDMDREKLYHRINTRTEQMFHDGVVEEVRTLCGKNLSATASAMIGLQPIVDHINGRFTLAETIDIVSRKTRNYAKRQLTWFRREERAEWIDRTEMTAAQVASVIYSKITSDGL